MPVKVLIVDDSGFFRNRIAGLLEGDPRITVVGSARNGKEAVEKVKQLHPDVVTMDVEMPEMNGIEALRVIMKECPTQVMMLSSLTHEGARITLQALEAGAVDFLRKDIRDWMDASSPHRDHLRDTIVSLANKRRRRPAKPSALYSPRLATKARLSAKSDLHTSPTKKRVIEPVSLVKNKTPNGRFPNCRIVVIGSSTGGPAALQKILTKLPAAFPYPILLIQHMPKTFTSVFAERLNQQCEIDVKEAEDGDYLKPGKALLAPGGHQLIIDPNNHDRVRVMLGDAQMTYKPSVDISYGSAANAFGSKVLAVILTGMGADGTEGAKSLKQRGSTLWAQDENSSTIFGMPKSVIDAGLADAVLDLTEIGTLLSKRGGS